MCFQIIDEPMTSEECFNDLYEKVRQSKITWKSYFNIIDGMETYIHYGTSYSATLSYIIDGSEEKFILIISCYDGSMHTFGKTYFQKLADIYNWLIEEEDLPDTTTNYVDTDYKIVSDEPFEFVKDVNWNSETM